jgi:hypothetical protein
MSLDEQDDILQTEFDRFAGILLTLKSANVHPFARDSSPRKRENIYNGEGPLDKRRRIQESVNDDVDSQEGMDDESDSDSEEDWYSSPKSTPRANKHISASSPDDPDGKWKASHSFSASTLDHTFSKPTGDIEVDENQSYDEFISAFYRLRTTRSKASQENQGDDIPACFVGYTKRRYTNTVACARHTLLHARCPPNCNERRPAKPHPRAKKYKLDEEEEEEVEKLRLDFERKEHEHKKMKLKGKRSLKKSNNSSTRPGRTGRKYLPQACERHKLLHARCPANCPDRIARDAENMRQKDDPQEEEDSNSNSSRNEEESPSSAVCAESQ